MIQSTVFTQFTETMTNKGVLVTGASGYIGSHCIVTLLEGRQKKVNNFGVEKL